MTHIVLIVRNSMKCMTAQIAFRGEFEPER
jgi:hypothetical protein